MAVLAQGPPRHTAMGLCLGSGIFWRKKATVGSPISVFCYVYCLVGFLFTYCRRGISVVGLYDRLFVEAGFLKSQNR